MFFRKFEPSKHARKSCSAIFHSRRGLSRINYNIVATISIVTTISWGKSEIKLLFQKLGIPVRNVNRVEEGGPFFIAG
jgi:hypothetical protein